MGLLTMRARHAEVFVIRLDGYFDSAERERLEDAFAIPSSGGLVVVDFHRVCYFDSEGIECLAELQRRTVARGAELVLVGLDPALKGAIERCEIDPRFDVRPSWSDMKRVPELEPAQMRTLTLVSRSDQYAFGT